VVIEDYLRLSTPGAGGAKSLYDTLTVREREIFQLLAEGLRTRKSPSACTSREDRETHRAHIMEKLNLNNIAELVKYSIEIGIVQLDT
jgi:two-component system response regulator NreC